MSVFRDYKCKRGHIHEVRESMDAPVEHDCPECGEKAKRQFVKDVRVCFAESYAGEHLEKLSPKW